MYWRFTKGNRSQNLLLYPSWLGTYYFIFLTFNTVLAFGQVLGIHWIVMGEVVGGRYCTGQGIIQQIGDIGVALSYLAVSCNTFLAEVWNMKQPGGEQLGEEPSQEEQLREAQPREEQPREQQSYEEDAGGTRLSEEHLNGNGPSGGQSKEGPLNEDITRVEPPMGVPLTKVESSKEQQEQPKHEPSNGEGTREERPREEQSEEEGLKKKRLKEIKQLLAVLGLIFLFLLLTTMVPALVRRDIQNSASAWLQYAVFWTVAPIGLLSHIHVFMSQRGSLLLTPLDSQAKHRRAISVRQRLRSGESGEVKAPGVLAFPMIFMISFLPSAVILGIQTKSSYYENLPPAAIAAAGVLYALSGFFNTTLYIYNEPWVTNLLIRAFYSIRGEHETVEVSPGAADESRPDDDRTSPEEPLGWPGLQIPEGPYDNFLEEADPKRERVYRRTRPARRETPLFEEPEMDRVLLLHRSQRLG
ncbi:hypothetical protein FRB96_001937 [Tulasnella sp. 330]|nr:hypothetical protein FRB96_001937 [Tulasnella sp. 330]KAG8872797.1 hypothetical protein FRB97_007342 [Tulasnella sp. 331]